MKINGSCHCGTITYEAELDPNKVGICHCSDCQSLSASAFRTIGVVDAGKFTLLTGEPTIYVKTGSSGNPREQAFCNQCGSAIYAAAAGPAPKVHNIRMGTVEQRGELPPQFEKWTQSAQDWMPAINPDSRQDRE